MIRLFSFLIVTALIGYNAHAAQTAFAALSGGPVSITQANPHTGKIAFTLPTELGALNFGISPDGQKLYVLSAAAYDGSGANAVTVFDIGSRTLLATIPLSAVPYTIALSPTGNHAFITAKDASGNLNLFVIDTQANAILRSAVYTQPGPTSYTQAAVSPNGLFLYYAQTTAIEIYQLSTLNRIASIPCSGCSAPAATQDYILAETASGVSAFSATTFQPVAQIPATFSSSLVATPDGSAVYFTGFSVPVSPTPELLRVDFNTFTLVSVLTLSTGGLVAISPDGNEAFVENEFFGLTSGAQLATLQQMIELAYHIALFSPSGDAIYILNDESSTLAKIDVTSATVIGQVGVGQNPASVVPNKSGQQVVVAAIDTASIVDTASGQSLRNFYISVSGYVPIAPARNQFYVPGPFGGIYAYDILTGQTTWLELPEAADYQTEINALVTTPDGTKLVTDVFLSYFSIFDSPANTDRGEFLIVFDTATNQQIVTLHVAPAGAIAIDPSSTFAYINAYGTTPDTRIQVLNLKTFQLESTWTFRDSLSFISMAVSPDGSKLYALDTSRGAVRMIDTSSGQQLGDFPVSPTSTAVALTPDGTKLFLSDSGSTSVTEIDIATGIETAIPVGRPSISIAVVDI